ncbi:hypothetical protein CGCS363_v000901 [Colletotrichum siamense]|uniref:uncharacterized protein n=1 Tax=Colletotrichum siamense TaxID=690259 RepID=UPI0018723883|nr:uncharacterized protein CGCS363_v000901 [Colletotrichum siamense]KAF5516315.1 hypothetical protein CGCS363_v000901 [Colletotrichum siamense]
MSSFSKVAAVLCTLTFQLPKIFAARQSYDVRKIIDAFRHPHDDLTILCAHRGLKWNGTTENSRDAYFRATEAGLECIETDIHLSLDGHLPMIHDGGLGRTTDVGEQTGQPAYNPFTGQGYNPLVSEHNFTGFIENLHLRDEQGRVHVETVPTLPEMVHSIYETGANVVLQLDFKEQAAVEPAYWALKNLTNRAGVPANDWCIYKLQAKWWKNPAEFEALEWVQDAFASGIQLAYIPVYNPEDEASWDTLTSLKEFASTNYTISAEIEVYSTGAPLQPLQDYIVHNGTEQDTFRTSGIFYAAGDLVDFITSDLTRFDTANYTIPDDIHTNNSVFVFQENKAPALLDSLVGNKSLDGHDYRSDFDWIIKQGFQWVITDIADVWDAELRAQGKRNTSYLLNGNKNDRANETASDDPIIAPTNAFNPTELNRPQVPGVFENVVAADDIQDFGWAAELNDNTPWTGDAFSSYTNIPSAAPNININPDLVTDLIADINTEISRRANFEPSMLVDNSLLLRPRKWRSAESSMTSRMMRGDILTYPEMLINGLNLPPFISPPCCGDERQCQESGSHQCLPQPLVACASIIRMWQANSPDNKAFIWRTIYMEQQKLLHEHESYEKETLIAAVQAAVLYTILHIEEVASIPKHYVRSLLITVGTMTFSMMNVRDMDYCHQTDEVPTRHEWICNQSMWRVTSFCYALNELLHIAKIPSSGNGGGPCRRVHLPSTRSLWTAKSNLEWQRQYAKQLSKRQLRDCYRIAHLREYAKYSGDSSAVKSWATDLDDWCLDHDELGTLIWMATKLDPV